MTSAYIPMSQRSIWSDVTPVLQSDGPNPLVPIMYTAEYKDAMDHFRAVSISGEHSERVLELTETIVRLNPAHYTVWQYRFETLLALKKPLDAELQLMNEFAQENLKSYQVWHHRLLLMTNLSPTDPSSEILFIHASLVPDPKNYHTWAYLHWIYSHFSVLGRFNEAHWKSELEWCENMITTDGRNNSAWGWRWYLRFARPKAPTASEDEDAIDEEISYALEAIHKIPYNLSAWNYLRAVLRQSQSARAPLLPSILIYTTRASSPSPLPTTPASYPWPTRTDPVTPDTPLPVPLALEFLAETLIEEGKSADAATVYKELADNYDRMRASYWELLRGYCLNPETAR